MEELIEKNVGDRKLFICLPPSYYQTNQHYPVVYVHDGHYLFSNNLDKLKECYQLNEIKEVIIVGMEPVNRLHEYTPWPAESLTPEYSAFNGEGPLYLAAWTSIKKYMDEHFRTINDAQATGMIGASLGGLISIYALFTSGSNIGKFGFLSPSLWYKDMLTFIEKTDCVTSEKIIYLYVGADEGKGKENVQQSMVPAVKRANKMLELKGFSREQLKFKIGENADHKREFFIEQFMYALAWLYKC